SNFDGASSLSSAPKGLCPKAQQRGTSCAASSSANSANRNGVAAVLIRPVSRDDSDNLGLEATIPLGLPGARVCDVCDPQHLRSHRYVAIIPMLHRLRTSRDWSCRQVAI